MLTDPGIVGQSKANTRLRVATAEIELLSDKPSSPPPLPMSAPARQRYAEQISHALARSILEGELKPGEVLAPQRDLAAQFNVSTLILRQAIHRLEDLGLVRVKLGSTTIVLDPAEAADLRVLELQLELSKPSPRHLGWLLEAQTATALGLLGLAEDRITEDEVAALVQLTENADATSAAELRKFRTEYWNLIAKATRNPLLRQSVRWWTNILGKLERSEQFQGTKDPLFPRLYEQLNRCLSEGSGSVALYLREMKKLHQATGQKREPRAVPEAAQKKRKRS